MAYPIEKKLVIAISSSALFDLSESNAVYENSGAQAYETHQQENIDNILATGVAYPFIKRFLSINEVFPEQEPVEVVLLSRNSAATGRRVFKSIAHYGLNITRAAFMEGAPVFEYIPAFNASLFLSAYEPDVLKAIEAGYPAGLIQSGENVIDDADKQLRIAFDFDGVIADDESESVYKKHSLDAFHEHESKKSHIPHNPGPLADLFKKLSMLQSLENKLIDQEPNYTRLIKTAIVTARGAPAHERVITTLEHWGVSANESFFLGGMSKERILSQLRPHMFFDDQKSHLSSSHNDIPMVHIPFGVANKLIK